MGLAGGLVPAVISSRACTRAPQWRTISCRQGIEIAARSEYSRGLGRNRLGGEPGEAVEAMLEGGEEWRGSPD